MTLVNDFLRYCYNQGWSGKIYDTFTYVTLAIHIIFLLHHRKHYQIPFLKSLIATVLMFAIGFNLSAALGWIESGFKSWGANNIVRVYIYLPILCSIISKVMKEQPIQMLTLLVPNIALQQVVGHIVCVFPGCCRGYPCSWGIWNPETESLLFPIQWLECIVSLGIFLFVLAYQKKINYTANGKVYPLFLILFGSTRFLLEFFRDNEKLILGISNLAFHALFMTVVGTVWLMVLEEKERQSKKQIVNRK